MNCHNPKTCIALFAVWIAVSTVLGVVVGQDDPRLHWMHPANFPHQWVIGDQSFQLRESTLDSLLTIEELRSLLDQKVPSAAKSPADGLVRQASFQEIRKSEGNRKTIENQNNGAVRQASYEDPVVEPEQEKTEDEESKTDINPSVTGATIYSTMKVDALQDEIRRQKEIISSDEQLGDAEKSSRLQMLASANEAILKYREFEGQRTKFENEIESRKDSEAALQAKLEEVIEPAMPEVDENTVSETLIRQVEKTRSKLARKKEQLNRIEKEIEFHTERVSKIPEDRSRAKKEMEASRKETSRLLSVSDSAQNKIALILQELRYKTAEEELRKLDVEVERQELSARVDPLKRDLLSREVKLLETEVQRWETEIKRLRKMEVEQEQKEAAEAAATAHPKIKSLAIRNEELINERQEVVESLQSLRTELEKVTDQIESIVERRNDINNKIEAAGLTGTNGMLLVDLRRTLASTGESHIRIRQLQTELRKVNLSKVSLIEERDELDDPIAAVARLVPSEDPESSLAKKALDFFHTKREYLYQLIEDYQTYGRRVSEVSQARKKLIDEINSTLNYVDKNALWIKSSEPLSLSSINETQQGVASFFNAESWINLITESQIRATQKPYESMFACFCLAVLIAFNRRIKNKFVNTEHDDE